MKVHVAWFILFGLLGVFLYFTASAESSFMAIPGIRALNYTFVSTNTFISNCGDDPLDDNCDNGFEGQPKQALTIEKAKLCDKLSNAILPKNSELVCDKDPTCRECRKHSIDKTTILSQGFHDKSLIHKRKLFISQNFNLNSSVIVSTVNFGQLYLLLNWACSCLKNGVFDPRQHMYIIPVDKKSYDVLSSFGFVAEPLDWYDIAHAKGLTIQSEYKNKANVGSHNIINSILAFASNFLVQMDYHVLLMDVDIVFLRNPFPYLQDAIKRRDLLGMTSPREDMYGYVNSGFVYFSPTRKSKLLLQSFENLSYIKATSDQQLFNAILRHPKFQQLEQRVLPRRLFFTLWKSTTKYGYDESKTYMLHAVSNDKYPRLKKINQWYFDEKCEFFHEAVYKEAKDNKALVAEDRRV